MKNLKIHILCGNAAYNRGDRGNLASQIALLRAAFPHASLSYDSYRPEVDRHWYDATVVKRGWLLSWPQFRALRKADVVVWGGGALIADNSCRTLIPMWIFILLVTKIGLRKPIMAWAHGTVIQTRLGSWLAKFAYSLTDAITVRDVNSYETIKKLKVRRPLFLTGDPAILIEAEPAERGKEILAAEKIERRPGSPLIAISPTFWPLYHRETDILPYLWGAKWLYKNRNRQQIKAFKSVWAQFAKSLVEKYGATVVFLPRYPSGPWPDRRHLADVVDATASAQVHLFRGDSVKPEAFLSLYRNCDLLVTTALHDAIFATAMRLPCLQLYYEKKGKDFFEACRTPERMESWEMLFRPDAVPRLIGLVDSALAGPALPSAAVQLARHTLRKRAASNVRVLKKWVLAKRGLGDSAGLPL